MTLLLWLLIRFAPLNLPLSSPYLWEIKRCVLICNEILIVILKFIFVLEKIMSNGFCFCRMEAFTLMLCDIWSLSLQSSFVVQWEHLLSVSAGVSDELIWWMIKTAALVCCVTVVGVSWGTSWYYCWGWYELLGVNVERRGWGWRCLCRLVVCLYLCSTWR